MWQSCLVWQWAEEGNVRRITQYKIHARLQNDGLLDDYACANGQRGRGDSSTWVRLGYTLVSKLLADHSRSYGNWKFDGIQKPGSLIAITFLVDYTLQGRLSNEAIILSTCMRYYPVSEWQITEWMEIQSCLPGTSPSHIRIRCHILFHCCMYVPESIIIL